MPTLLEEHRSYLFSNRWIDPGEERRLSLLKATHALDVVQLVSIDLFSFSVLSEAPSSTKLDLHVLLADKPEGGWVFQGGLLGRAND